MNPRLRSRRAATECTGAVPPEASTTSHEVRFTFASRPLLLLVLAALLVGLSVGMLDDHETATPISKRQLSGHSRLVENVVYAPDGRTLASCGWDRTVRLWNVDEQGDGWGQEIATLPHESHVFSVAMTRDGHFLGTGGVQTFTIWERRADGRWDRRVAIEGTAHRTVAASPDDRTLAAGCSDGTIQLWDLTSLRVKSTLAAFSDEVHDLAFSTDGSYLVGSAFNGQLAVWRLREGCEPERRHIDCGTVVAFGLNPEAPILATSSGIAAASRVTLWNLATGKEMLRVPGCELGNNILSFSPDGRILASGDKDNRIRLRDASTGELLDTLDDNLGWVKSMAFSPDGRRLAFGGQDGSVRFREVPGKAAEQVASTPVPAAGEVPSKKSGARTKTVLREAPETPCG